MSDQLKQSNWKEEQTETCRLLQILLSVGLSLEVLTFIGLAFSNLSEVIKEPGDGALKLLMTMLDFDTEQYPADRIDVIKFVLVSFELIMTQHGCGSRN